MFCWVWEVTTRPSKIKKNQRTIQGNFGENTEKEAKSPDCAEKTYATGEEKETVKRYGVVKSKCLCFCIMFPHRQTHLNVKFVKMRLTIKLNLWYNLIEELIKISRIVGYTCKQ